MNEFKGTLGEWKLHLARYRDTDPIFGFSIRAEGKEPFVASAGVSSPNHCLIVSEEYRKHITTGFTEWQRMKAAIAKALGEST